QSERTSSTGRLSMVLWVMWATHGTAAPLGSSRITLQNFDQANVPLQLPGSGSSCGSSGTELCTYPIYYEGAPEDSGRATLSIDTTDKIQGLGSLKFTTLSTPSGLYAQFNPYDGSGRHFAHDMAACSYPTSCGSLSDWTYGRYNRLS